MPENKRFPFVKGYIFPLTFFSIDVGGGISYRKTNKQHLKNKCRYAAFKDQSQKNWDSFAVVKGHRKEAEQHPEVSVKIEK